MARSRKKKNEKDTNNIIKNSATFLNEYNIKVFYAKTFERILERYKLS